MIEVIDNYLDADDWARIYQKCLTAVPGEKGLEWGYSPTIAKNGDNASSTGYFIHIIKDDIESSKHFDMIAPLIRRLDLDHYKTLYRSKVNMYPRTNKVEEHAYHYDLVDEDQKIIDHLNCVYYVNSNNGFTLFEDGSRIRSVENRMVIFSGKYAHSSTSCTDEPVRVSINMNMVP